LRNMLLAQSGHSSFDLTSFEITWRSDGPVRAAYGELY
jgi:hypothetical protein